MAANGRPKLCLPPPRSAEERDRCRTMFESEASYREINEAVGTPISTLRVWCRRDQWRKITKADVEIVPADATIVADDVPDDLPSQQEEYQANMARAGVLMSRKVAAMPADEVIQKADKIKSLDGVNRKALRIETEKPSPVINIGVLCSPIKDNAVALRNRRES